MSGYDRRNKKVFRRCLKTGSDGAEVMSAGNSFHKSAPTTGNDRLPTSFESFSGNVHRVNQVSGRAAVAIWAPDDRADVLTRRRRIVLE